MFVTLDVGYEQFDTFGCCACVTKENFARTSKEFHLVDHFVVGGGGLDCILTCGGKSFRSLALCVFEVEDELLGLLGLCEKGFSFNDHERREILWGKFSGPDKFPRVERRN